jgi:hypothetical protein
MNDDYEVPDDASALGVAGYLVSEVYAKDPKLGKAEWKRFQEGAENIRASYEMAGIGLQHGLVDPDSEWLDRTLAQQYEREAVRLKEDGDPVWRLWAAWAYEQAVENEEPLPSLNWRL